MRSRQGRRVRDGFASGETPDRPNVAASSLACVGEAGGPSSASGLDAMTAAKLWENPCWLTYRLNYLALRYNVPLYNWVERTYGLSRPEYVVIYSLGLKDGALARDIASSSGFPQNTLSRAIQKLVGLGMIERTADDADRRCNVLRLTKEGRALFEQSLPRFVDFEQMMLEALDEDERKTLSALMAKLVVASTGWPGRIDPEENSQEKSER
ncbi:winged helix-turn-helix transcriptional regulator [Rhizobiales bacterium]|uniref:MarR family winged helix-turn-helix transcriptional regulator n=1 Tax=Hongsoonwoonella zoysiae TaxID=2821844 RepID=UPI00155FBD90|nr:MarR family winged helix-turn-helix transcriptional regulator [Hongsoonwoonella zoysiae]NRG16279.1 winged helix-turn-helix transcriptional regulator [Hongsoonwoonella zoysiae]